MSNFEVVKGDSQEGEVFNKLIESARPRFDYDGLVKAFNDLEPGSKDLIKFEYPPASMTNFSAMMESRGLEKNKDYEASGLTSKADGNYYIFLRRKSTAEGHTLGEKDSTPPKPAEETKQEQAPPPAPPPEETKPTPPKPAEETKQEQAPPPAPPPEETKPAPPPTQPTAPAPKPPEETKQEQAAPAQPKGSNPPPPQGQKPPPPPPPPKPAS